MGKQAKHCVHGFYHLGCFAALIGLLLMIVGISIHNVFEIFIYDQRPLPSFHQVKVKVGLFGNTPMLINRLGRVYKMKTPLVITDSRWIAAKWMAILGILGILIALPIHIINSIKTKFRKWWIILIELSLYFMSMICVLICLSLSESEIEVIHDSDDSDLRLMLLRNNLLQKRYPDMILSNKFPITTEPSYSAAGSSQKYNLLLSRPGGSFYLYIVTEFFVLFAFLCSLVFFIRISEIDEERKKKINLQHV